MPSTETILEVSVPPDGILDVVVPGLRWGDIEPDTSTFAVDGTLQTDVEYSLDFTHHLVSVKNIGPVDWALGAVVTLTWEGELLEQKVDDLSLRTTALEANLGVTDGTDAAPGTVGEYLSIDNMTGVTPAANVPVQICSIDLPPGCWEVWGACDFTIAALGADPQATPVQPNQLAASISVTTDSLPTDTELILGTGVMNLIFSPLAAGQRQVLITGQCRSNSVDPITLYLVAAVGSANATIKGYISARRVR